MEEQNNTQDTQQQERSTRWDKAQKKKESGRIKKQQAALSITSTRSRTIANSRNIDTDLQGEIVSLVIKNPKDIIKGLQNKRKKSDKTVVIPNDITIQGES